MTDTDLVAGLRDHAAAVEIIAKALPDAASATKEWSGRTASLARQAADRLEALSKPLSDAKVVEIRARHNEVDHSITWRGRFRSLTDDAEQAHADRAALLSDRETLIRERDEARAALEPFANEAKQWHPNTPDDVKLWGNSTNCAFEPTTLTVGHLRAAAIRSMKGEK